MPHAVVPARHRWAPTECNCELPGSRQALATAASAWPCQGPSPQGTCLCGSENPPRALPRILPRPPPLTPVHPGLPVPSALQPVSAEHRFTLRSQLPSGGAPGQATSTSADTRPALLAPAIAVKYCRRHQLLSSCKFAAAPAGGDRQMDVSPPMELSPHMSTGYASVGFKGKTTVWRWNVHLSIPV